VFILYIDKFSFHTDLDMPAKEQEHSIKIVRGVSVAPMNSGPFLRNGIRIGKA